MEPLLAFATLAAVVAAVVAAVLVVAHLLGRSRRRRREPVEGLGAFLAGVPVTLSRRDEELALEEGALDPDELEGDPLYWDEGADDEVG